MMYHLAEVPNLRRVSFAEFYMITDFDQILLDHMNL